MSQPSEERPGKSWPDYRAVWRWHFYAGIFCIPFVIVLSLSGALYLFKTEIEAWNDRPYDGLHVQGRPASAAEQITAALAAFPAATFSSYELPTAADSAARISVREEARNLRVYVHPQTLEVLHSIPENDRFMRLLFRLHGELWMGNRGSNLVELAASWTIILILTGAYLWWPRNSSRLAGVLYPRLRGGSRQFWRDLHSVTGVWISALALFLLLSGLPWAKFWGDYFKTVRSLTGTAVARQEWSNSSESAASRRSSGEHGEHGGSDDGRRPREKPTLPDLTAVDRIVAAIAPLGLQPPVVIAPPGRGATDWTAKSMTPNRPWRVNLVVDPRSGEIVSRDGFAERHWIDKVVAVGIAAHEGRLFGWPNQFLGLLTAAGLVLISVSGVILWWRRRDQGVLGAPRPFLSPRVAWGLIVLVVLLGVCLPLFGGSLLIVLVVEKLILSRIPVIRDWLGLRHSASVA